MMAVMVGMMVVVTVMVVMGDRDDGSDSEGR
jgi:hypothetical protein